MSRRHKRGRPVHGILLLDKPAGGSSNHALQRAKRIYSARKAGHTGSLDPLATGMLPICFGEATKLAAYLLDADKGYETTLKLGVTTHTADSDGEVIETRAVPAELDAEQFTAVCKRFSGDIRQIPPMVSAIKIDGKRLYKLAREGKEVERPARAVTIHELEVLSFSGDTARLAVRCSKGTYIRSLVTDIGEAIGCGAHVTALRRTFVAPFEKLPMITLDTLEQMTQPMQWEGLPATAEESSEQACWPTLDSLLLAPDAGLNHMNIVTLDDAAKSAFMHGNPAACSLGVDNPPAETLCRVYDKSGQLIGMGDFASSGTVSPRRVFQWG